MNNHIAIYHAAPRMGDLLIHLGIYNSIFHNTGKKIIFICSNKKLASVIFDKVNFINQVVEFRVKKGFNQIKNFYNFKSIVKNFNIEEIYIIEKNTTPAFFSYLSGINKIFSYGIKPLQKIFIKNDPININLKYDVELSLATDFLKKLNFKKKDFYFQNIAKDTNTIFICNKASDEKRKWPRSHLFDLVSKILIKDPSLKIYLNIDINDFNEIKFKFKDKVISTIDLSIEQLIKVIMKCKFSLSIDTGPSHLSLRLLKKTFVLYTSTLPQIYSPNHFPLISPYIKDKNKLEISNNKSSDINVDFVWNILNDQF